MSSLIVRKAKPRDIDRLGELRLSLQRHGERSNARVWRITEKGKSLLRQKLENALTDENSITVVALMGERIVGFVQGQVDCRLKYSPKYVGAISGIFVSERLRRKGVGRRLVVKLCEFFSSRNVETVTLRYIIGNKEAQEFWNKLGFKPVIETATTSLKQLQEQVLQNEMQRK